MQLPPFPTLTKLHLLEHACRRASFDLCVWGLPVHRSDDALEPKRSHPRLRSGGGESSAARFAGELQQAAWEDEIQGVQGLNCLWSE